MSPKPRSHRAIWFKWREHGLLEATFAVDDDALIVAKVAEFVWLYLVLLSFIVVHIAFARAESPGAFDDALLAEKISGLHRISFVGGSEDHAVAEIQREHLRFVVAKWRHKRSRALRRGDNGRPRLA